MARSAVPLDVSVDEISQLPVKPNAHVPCSMTPVESALRPMLPSAFLDGVGLHTFFTGLNHTARSLAVYASAQGSPPAPQDALPAAPSALAGRGWLPAGFSFEVSVHGILLNQALLAHQGDREIGRIGRFLLFEAFGDEGSIAVAIHRFTTRSPKIRASRSSRSSL